jgi:hypothetical protein
LAIGNKNSICEKLPEKEAWFVYKKSSFNFSVFPINSSEVSANATFYNLYAGSALSMPPHRLSHHNQIAIPTGIFILEIPVF